VYRRLVPQAAQRARRGVLLEIGKGQHDDVGALLVAEGLRVVTAKDLAGVERVVIGER
jgi:hypothetical protein